MKTNETRLSPVLKFLSKIQSFLAESATNYSYPSVGTKFERYVHEKDGFFSECVKKTQQSKANIFRFGTAGTYISYIPGQICPRRDDYSG